MGPAFLDQAITAGAGLPKALRTTVVLGSVAVAATGLTVGGGVLVSGSGSGSDADQVAVDANTAGLASSSRARAGLSADELAARADEVVTRSEDRTDRRAADSGKEALLDGATDGPAATGKQDLADADPREIGRALLSEFGFGADQFSCLDSLYMSESGWRVDADNPSSSAYGIPQALPGNKMASAGDDWETNPVTQIRWGLGYIEDRYGSPCSAWSFKQGNGWY